MLYSLLRLRACGTVGVGANSGFGDNAGKDIVGKDDADVVADTDVDVVAGTEVGEDDVAGIGSSRE